MAPGLHVPSLWVIDAATSANRLLKNYLRWQYCVKNGLKMLIYST